MNILEALDDPNLLGAAIRDPESWKPWRAFLATAFGLAMDDDAAGLSRQCTGRAGLPGKRFQFSWLVIGRRGGKSFCMAIIAVYLACFKDWRRFLSPGERVIVLSWLLRTGNRPKSYTDTLQESSRRHCCRLWSKTKRRTRLT